MESSNPFARAAYWLALCATVLASAEITARLEDRLRLGIPFWSAPSDRDLVVRDEFGMRGRPNARYKKWRLNSAGFRNAETRAEPLPNCRRVMVLGASESFGLYESEGKEYPAQLSELLKRHGCYEVINAAIAGMTVRTIGSFWDNWASRFGPAIVVIYPSPAFYLAATSPSDVPPAGPVSSPVAAPVEWWRPRIASRALDILEVPAVIQRWRVRRWLEQARAGQPSSWMFDTVPRERLHDFVSDVEQLVCRIAATGARPVVVTHATAFHVPVRPEERHALDAWNVFTPRAAPEVLVQFEREAAAALLEMAAARRVVAVDAATHMYGRRDWFAGDLVHFSDDGAGAIAELIAARLLQPWPEPPSPSAEGCGGEHAHAVQ